ncbi:MAG: hypothetical protein QM516_10765 [Limnohabitans sp.]|jgi:hypothetical protein|nr:hypothetical protein [Limnohabitans sp.]
MTQNDDAREAHGNQDDADSAGSLGRSAHRTSRSPHDIEVEKEGHQERKSSDVFGAFGLAGEVELSLDDLEMDSEATIEKALRAQVEAEDDLTAPTPARTMRGARGDGTERPSDAFGAETPRLPTGKRDDEGFRYSGSSMTFGRFIVERNAPSGSSSPDSWAPADDSEVDISGQPNSPAAIVLAIAGVVGLFGAATIVVFTRLL